MTTASDLQAAVFNILTELGWDVTFKVPTGPPLLDPLTSTVTNPTTDVIVKASPLYSDVQDYQGTSTQQLRAMQLVIHNEGLSFVPEVGMTVTAAAVAWRIQQVAEHQLQGTAVAYELWLERGGGL